MMNAAKVRVKNTKKYGRGVFATRNVRKNEVVAVFDGPIYDEKFDGWTNEINNHVMQFKKNAWRDSLGPARYINHSCEPNCGIKDLFKVVAMRSIKKGEEITWDYEMTENSWWWRLKCRCGSAICRKIIGRYKNLPESLRKKYKGYISEWLLKKS